MIAMLRVLVKFRVARPTRLSEPVYMDFFNLQCTNVAKIYSFLASKYTENAFAGLRTGLRPDPAGDLNPLTGFKWATSRQGRGAGRERKDARRRGGNVRKKEKGRGRKKRKERKERKGRMIPQLLDCGCAYTINTFLTFSYLVFYCYI